MREKVDLPEDLAEESCCEAEHFDKEYSTAMIKQRKRSFIVPERFIRQVTHSDRHPLGLREYGYSLIGNLGGKKILDYGCGDGWNSICFAKAGASVWAIDVSEVGIELTKVKAKANGVDQLIIAEVRNCYATGYPKNMFDVIYGGGILHHLNIEAAGQELSRILKPDGVAVFSEPFRDAELMYIIKKVILQMAGSKVQRTTNQETPVTRNRLQALRPYFGEINCCQFNIISPAGELFNSKFLKSIFLWADYFIKFIPGFERLGMAAVIELRSPKKCN